MTTTTPTADFAAASDAASSTEYRVGRVTAAAGIAALILLAVFIQISANPDATDRVAFQNWLADGLGSSHAVAALAVGALSYVPFIAFFAGLRRLVWRWDPSGLTAGVVGIGAAMFLAGNIAADAGTMAIPLARHAAAWFAPGASEAVLFDRLWLVTLTESQTALATVVGAAAAAGWLARRRGDVAAPPRFLIWWGLLALPAMIPVLLMPGTAAVFIPSNMFRLLWIAALSAWLLIDGRRRSRRLS
jgi:hypothetical protein